MKNTSTIEWSNGTFQRVVRHQRTLNDGIRVGTIRDKGYLVAVYLASNGLWQMCGTIRKLKCA